MAGGKPLYPEQPGEPDGKKKANPLVGLLVLGLLFAGCVELMGDDEPSRATRVAPAPRGGSSSGGSSGSASTSRRSATEARYIDFVRKQLPGAAASTDAELVRGGRALCEVMDDIETLDQLAITASVLGFDVEDVGVALVAAVESFCPRHRDLIHQ